MAFGKSLKDTLEDRDTLFLLLSGIFLTSLVLGNLIGTTKFVNLFEFELSQTWKNIIPPLIRENNVYRLSVPVGVLAYPFTFLATDLISELYGRKKAQGMVIVGFLMNLFMLFLMTVNHWLPNAEGVSGGLNLFEGIYDFLVANTIASMIAYLVAQSIDVQLFHFWKRITRGRYKWIRNNGSTLVSQLVDSISILSILYISGNLGGEVQHVSDLIILILNSYVFKFFFALFDTPLFYLGSYLLRNYKEDPIEFVYE